MKAINIQTFVKKAIGKRVPVKRGKKLLSRCYQAYEAYEDHVDSFVLNEITNGEISPAIDTHQTFAKMMIVKRVRNKQRQVVVNSYGESLYGDHVDSPSYDDYLEYNSGDNE